MHVKEGVGELGLETLDDRMAEGEIGNKMAVHHIQVKVVRTSVQQSPPKFGKLLTVSVRIRIRFYFDATPISFPFGCLK